MREGARRMLTNAVRGVHLPVLVLGTAALVWEFLTWLFNVPRFLLPPPSAIFAGIFDNLSLLVFHSVYTLEFTLMGFGLAVVLGVVLAVCIVQFKFLEKTLYTLLISLNSIPKVAIAPLFIVWMGTGLEPKVAIAAMIAIFAIVIDMVHGLRSVDPEMIDLGRALRGSGYKIMVKIRFPHALPSLFAGMKVGISLALIGAIVGEFVAAKRGLGYMIMVAQGQFDVVLMFGAFVILAVLGTVLFFLVEAAERLLLPWYMPRRTTEMIQPTP